MNNPNFFIVGAPKCGTTAMTYYLMQHPEIYMAMRVPPKSQLKRFAQKEAEILLPKVKELHFFGSDLEFRTPRMSQKEYLSYFDGVVDEKRIGEVSIWYLYSRMAVREIKAFNPDADIIIMLRNPVELMYSQYGQMVYRGYEAILDFESALQAESERKQGRRLPDMIPLIDALFYREIVQFTSQVKRYLDIFGRERVHIIIFDDLKADTAAVYRETLRFLGVDESFKADLKVVNSSKRVRNRRIDNFIRRPPVWLKCTVKVLTPRFFRRKLVHLFSKLNIENKPRPPMDPELNERLRAEFAGEVKQLGQLIDRDLTFWI